jgi:HSP20 family protein
MRLIPWQPFFEDEEMNRFMKPFQAFMPTVGTDIFPPVDIYEDGGALVVETPVAGVDPAKIEVSVQNDVLTIKGTMERKTEVDEKNYYRKEVRSGSLFRTIPLPVHVLERGANASYENGMLKIEVPKGAEEKQTIKINVKSKNDYPSSESRI